MREMVEQGRLACVGVTDDRHGRQAAAATTLALQLPCGRQVLEVGLELADTPHDPPAVDFELGFTGAESGADTTALLRQLGRGTTTQPWKAVAQQRQLDLRLALEGVR